MNKSGELLVQLIIEFKAILELNKKLLIAISII